MPIPDILRKAILALISLLFSAQCLPQAAADSSVITQKIKVYIVGTFHFDGAGGDVYKTSAINMRTPDKQMELDTLAQRLAKAMPDKIFVEWTPDRQAYADST